MASVIGYHGDARTLGEVLPVQGRNVGNTQRFRADEYRIRSQGFDFIYLINTAESSLQTQSAT